MGILDALGSGMQKVGSALQSGFSGFGQQFQPPADPNAMNTQYGVPEGDVYQQRMQSLQRMAALYMAAGQSMSGKDRAMILAQLGNNNPTTDFYNMAQARLMNTRVQDAERQRQQKLQALQEFQNGGGLSDNFDDRTKEAFDMYLKAGDLDGALDVISKYRAQRSEGVLLSDGSMTSKGVYQDNNKDWNKNYQPFIRNLRTNTSIAQEARAAIQSGVFSGALGPAKLAATKLMRAAGVNVDIEDINNTERLRAAVMPAILERMAMLGGNDSNEELRTMMASLAGDTLEPETLLQNFDRMEKAAIRDAAQARAQKRLLTTNGGTEYGTYVDINEDDIPEEYRKRWNELNGKSQPTEASGGVATPQTQEEYDALPKGAKFIDPEDGKTYTKD